MKKHWLITAFDPFAGRAKNNSQTTLEEMQRLAEVREKNAEWPFRFHYLVLPTEYDRSSQLLLAEVSRLEKMGVKIDGVLSLGEGADEFKLETQAHNLDDVENYPDNAGVVRTRHLPLKDHAEHIIPLRFPYEAFGKIRTSKNAGYFVCNNLSAWMGREYASEQKPYFGFIHVPREGMGGIFTAELCAEIILIGFSKIK
jgi:pyrrolidone-carboxylate peptidase